MPAHESQRNPVRGTESARWSLRQPDAGPTTGHTAVLIATEYAATRARPSPGANPYSRQEVDVGRSLREHASHRSVVDEPTCWRQMAEHENFVDETLRREHLAEEAFYLGSPEPFKDMWSHADDVSLFGAFGPCKDRMAGGEQDLRLGRQPLPRRQRHLRLRGRLRRNGPRLMCVQHKVADFDSWKSVFDEQGDGRKAHGAVGHRVLRRGDDANSVMVLTEFPERAMAESYLALPWLGPGSRERLRSASGKTPSKLPTDRSAF